MDTKYLLYQNKKTFLKILSDIFKWMLIIGLSYVILFPVIKLFVPSFTHITELDDPAVIWLPSKFTFDTIIVAFQLMNYGSTLLITVLYTLLLVVIQTLIASLVGYAFARFKFPLKKFWMVLLVITIIIPFFTIEMSTRYYYTNFSLFGLIPLFNNGQTINLIDNPIVYIIINLFGQGLKGGLFIFIFIKFYSGIPDELEESALIDGAGFFKIYSKIILPNAMPALITCIVLSFVWNYGDYQNSALFNSNMNLLPNVLLRNVANVTYIPTYISRVYIYPRTAVTDMMIGAAQNAAILLFMLPVLIGYLLIQKRFVEGFERSGIVG